MTQITNLSGEAAPARRAQQS